MHFGIPDVLKSADAAGANAGVSTIGFPFISIGDIPEQIQTRPLITFLFIGFSRMSTNNVSWTGDNREESISPWLREMGEDREMNGRIRLVIVSTGPG